MTTQAPTQIHVQAEIELHRKIADAHEAFARALEPLAEDQAEDRIPALRGATKRRVTELPGMYAERGMSASEIAAALGQDIPNVYPDLESLSESGFAERIQGASPKRWRMTIKHRRSRILRMSRLIPDGSWTSYGDFAIAVYGSNKMAITVGRVASRNPIFVKPQRVLWAEARSRMPGRTTRAVAPRSAKNDSPQKGSR